MHALVWWGFLVILVGSIEMVIDGLAGTERVLGFLGAGYDVLLLPEMFLPCSLQFLLLLFFSAGCSCTSNVSVGGNDPRIACGCQHRPVDDSFSDGDAIGNEYVLHSWMPGCRS
jgi:hypothetical protein